jgi:hypothetical protein
VAAALVLSLLTVLLVRRAAGGRWVFLVFLAGYALKAAAVFHPSYFYNDVRTFERYVLALRDGEGGVRERGVRAQVETGVAYPRIVGGRPYAFPYSPLFFLVFTRLPEERIVEAEKHLALAAAAAEVVAVFALSRLVCGSRAAVAATAVAAALPPLYNRLLLAMWATIAGHLLDLLAILATALLAARPASLRRWLTQAGATLAAVLSYISSLFSLTLFGAFAAALHPPLGWRVALGWAVSMAVALGWLYSRFVSVMIREILPAMLAGGTPAATGLGPAVLAALARVPIFYGWGYPALAVAGFVVVQRRASPALFRVVAAYALALLALIALRALSGGLFKDLKEIEFAAPLVALTTGTSLEELARRGRRGVAGAALIACGLIAFSASRYVSYLRAYASLVGVP